ncbi:MAG: efflux RND transporter periplasmic adaptor subunit [Deltaproteobacteria bacterium]|nr:efflux RND transporter periplasmic adaptor subunit [Deltaproteobacteria bacterium]
MKANRRTVLVLSFCLAVTAATLTAACSKGPSGPPQGPTEVGTVTVNPEKVVLTTELPGRTSPFLVAEVRPQVNGIIRERAFEEGSDVKAGALLYQIDPAPYQAAFDQAKASLAMAEANVPAARSRADRLKGLVAIRAAGQQDYDDASAAALQAEASVAAAKAALDSARVNLSYTPIRAPIPGRTGRSNVTVGALVTAYQPAPLATVQQLDPIYVDVVQSSSELLRLRRGFKSGDLSRSGTSWSKVKLVLEDGIAYSKEGKLKFQDVTVDPTTGSVSLRMVFPNPDHVLLPGMFVRAIVEQGENQNAILVPQQAVTRDAKGTPLALVVGKDGKVEQRILEIDRALGDRWLVTKGLAAGDQVIVDGIQRVRPGADAKAVPFAAPVEAKPGADVAAKAGPVPAAK